jgi:hypothetical protein
MEWEGDGYPVKGMFCRIVRNLSGALMFLSETKQHPAPISANIPDKANEAVLPCRITYL